MQRSRIVSVVEDTWGKGTVYTDEPEKDVKDIKKKSSHGILKSVSSAPLTVIDEDKEHEDQEEHITDDDPYGLSYFQSSLFATILEDTITELRILQECNNEMRITKAMADMGLLLAIKYKIRQPETKDELDGIDPRNLQCVEYKLDKLDSDRKYFDKVLVATYKDLSMNRSFFELNNHVEKTVARDDYRVYIELEETKNKATRRELAKQQRVQRNHYKTVIYDTEVVIDDLQTQVEDAALNAEIRGRYIDNWQRARTEQHIQTIDDTESYPSNTIEYYKQRSDFEQRVHSEVELLVNIAINETLEKVEQWMDKYDKDMEAIDLKIQIKKNDYQNQLDKRVGLEETIEKHDQMMKDWIHFKDEREKLRLYREKMTKSAITVQAWWRGMLVRRQLGPYKVSKKKGGGKDKKK